MSPSKRPVIDYEASGPLGLLTVIILILEFMAALWIRGVIFTAALFGGMSLLFGVGVFAVYVLNYRAVRRGAEVNAGRREVLGAICLVGLVSSACIALIAGIFSIPLLSNGGFRQPRPVWRIPAILGENFTSTSGGDRYEAWNLDKISDLNLTNQIVQVVQVSPHFRKTRRTTVRISKRSPGDRTHVIQS
jgi:hypothetical protein